MKTKNKIEKYQGKWVCVDLLVSLALEKCDRGDTAVFLKTLGNILHLMDDGAIVDLDKFVSDIDSKILFVDEDDDYDDDFDGILDEDE